jgi:hypothetical protein
MMTQRSTLTFVLALAAALPIACSGGDDDDGTVIKPPRDGGMVERDGGDVTGRDGGPRDGGATPRDGGMTPRDGGSAAVCGNGICEPGENAVSCAADCAGGPCPRGTEGCACSSSFTAGDMAYAQDDCADTAHLCIPWDTLSGNMMLTGPLQSCVQPCTNDSECGNNANGTGRRCVNMDITGIAGAPDIGSVCVDREADLDQICGGSRNTTSVVTDVNVITGMEMVGCANDATCLFNVGLNPDEGVCTQLCGAGRPMCPMEAPYCNPGLINLGDGEMAGVCNVAQLGFGAFCDFTDDPNGAGFTAFCDQGGAADLACLNLRPINIPAGICIEECNVGGTGMDDPCVSTDATNPVECVVLDAMTGDGVCIHTNAPGFPDMCPGAGAFNLGRQGFGVVFGQSQIPASWCVPRLGPTVAPSALSSVGQLSLQGGNCQATPLDGFRCPEPSLCVGDGQGGGLCIVGCELADGAGTCAADLMTIGVANTGATCIMTGTSTVVGLCGGD